MSSTAAHAPAPAPAAAPAGTPAAPAPRLGELVGDRCCVNCQFNLAGQTITREPHYGLPIITCPECGTIAALQEYPALSRWVPRFRAAMATLLIIGVLAYATLCALLAHALSYGVSRMMAEPWSDYATRAFPASSAAGPPDPDWWNKLPPSRLFADAGGWSAGIEWGVLWYCVPACALAACFGAVWSILLPHLRGWRMLIVPAAIAGLTFLMVAGTWRNWSGRGMNAWVVGQLAFHHVRPLLTVLIVGIVLLALLLGMFVGRALARRVIVLTLPPRLRIPFSFLWTADGVPLPRP